ncbi:hypothetical protein MRX96_001808 [Rhipicephalus microplus]
MTRPGRSTSRSPLPWKTSFVLTQSSPGKPVGRDR